MHGPKNKIRNIYRVFVYFCGFREGHCGIYNFRLKMCTSFEVLLREYVVGSVPEQVWKFWGKAYFLFPRGSKLSFPGCQNRGVFPILTELSRLYFCSLSRIVRMI